MRKVNHLINEGFCHIITFEFISSRLKNFLKLFLVLATKRPGAKQELYPKRSPPLPSLQPFFKKSTVIFFVIIIKKRDERFRVDILELMRFIIGR